MDFLLCLKVINESIFSIIMNSHLYTFVVLVIFMDDQIVLSLASGSLFKLSSELF